MRLCAELILDCDEDAEVEFYNVNYGSYFSAYICGKTKGEVIDKLMDAIDRFRIITTFDSTYSDLMYERLMDMKMKAKEKGFDYFYTGGNQIVSFEFVHDKVHDVYL